MSDSYSNPFSGSNAKMLNDEDILNYWCNPLTINYSQIFLKKIYLHLL